MLSYHETESGWNERLTKLHEEATGASHFIDRASRKNAIRALSAVLQKSNPAILEVGSSSGFLLEDLQRQAKHASLVGSDFISGPLHQLAGRLRGVPLVQFDITQCPLADSSFDAVVMLNVLEHVEDDLAALKQLYRILKPGGVTILEVPAGPHLYDFYDKHLMHYRRYRLGDLKQLAQNTGFEVERASHLGFILYPLFSIVKKRNKKRGENLSELQRQLLVSEEMKKGSENPLLRALMRIELALGKYFSYPTGIRCLLVLRKGDRNVLH